MFLSFFLKTFPICPMDLAKYSLAIPVISGRDVFLCLVAALGEKSARFTQYRVVLAVYFYKVKRIPNVQPSIFHDLIEWYIKNTVVLSIKVTFLFLIFQVVPFDLCSGFFSAYPDGTRTLSALYLFYFWENHD